VLFKGQSIQKSVWQMIVTALICYDVRLIYFYVVDTTYGRRLNSCVRLLIICIICITMLYCAMIEFVVLDMTIYACSNPSAMCIKTAVRQFYAFDKLLDFYLILGLDKLLAKKHRYHFKDNIKTAIFNLTCTYSFTTMQKFFVRSCQLDDPHSNNFWKKLKI
jgi:hypothetical protein